MPAGNVPILPRVAGVYTGFAYEVLTVTTAVKTLTAGSYIVGDKRAQVAQLTVESNGVNYTYDGTPPTATVGHNLPAGSSLVIQGMHNIENFKMFRSGASDATVKVTYEA
jgi:hypothetical protein